MKISVRDAAVSAERCQDVLTETWQAALGLRPGTCHLGQAFIMSHFGFSFEELLYFRLILKEWKIGIGSWPRKDETKDDFIPVALVEISGFLFQQGEVQFNSRIN